MLKSSAAELNKIAEVVKRVLICSHSTQAGDIARRVYEKFQAQEKVDNEKLNQHKERVMYALNRQHKPSCVDPKRSPCL